MQQGQQMNNPIEAAKTRCTAQPSAEGSYPVLCNVSLLEPAKVAQAAGSLYRAYAAAGSLVTFSPRVAAGASPRGLRIVRG
jgi:hypothetical protein